MHQCRNPLPSAPAVEALGLVEAWQQVWTALQTSRGASAARLACPQPAAHACSPSHSGAHALHEGCHRPYPPSACPARWAHPSPKPIHGTPAPTCTMGQVRLHFPSFLQLLRPAGREGALAASRPEAPAPSCASCALAAPPISLQTRGATLLGTIECMCGAWRPHHSSWWPTSRSRRRVSGRTPVIMPAAVKSWVCATGTVHAFGCGAEVDCVLQIETQETT